MTSYSISTEQHSCCFRWAVDVNTVPDESVAKLSALLPGTEQAEVVFYRQKDDQKRALISRLLQRACMSMALGVEWDAVVIERTRCRKPFAASHLPRPAHAPNFNFNVSHEVK